MKKLFSMLLVAGALALSACAPTIVSASSSESGLKSKGYTTQVLSYTEAKARIQGLNYNVVEFINAVFAEKGTGEDHDLFIGFYFSSADAADQFTSANNYENLGLLNDYGDKNLGENLTKKVGYHNNVAYVGSSASFSAAFGV